MTTLMEEVPYAAVVNDTCRSFVCSNCFISYALRDPGVQLSRCAGCRVLYYCSKKCQKGDWEGHKAECKFFRSLPAGTCPDQNVRLVFRMIMKHRSQPDLKAFNGRTYDSLPDYRESHRKIDKIMNHVKRIHAEIQSYMGPEAPSFETVFLALSKKAANAYGICDGTVTEQGTGIYLGLSVHGHSCSPDAFVISKGSKLLLRTTKKDCVYSDKLTVNYLYGGMFRDTFMRRFLLSLKHNLDCKCEECEDIEADKKRTSGRPRCCPKGWFSLIDLRCSICNKEVPSELGKAVEAFNKFLREYLMLYVSRQLKSPWHESITFAFIKVFESHKEFLSDENTYLIGIAEMISNSGHGLETTIKYTDVCLAQMRERPFGPTRARFLFKRFMFYEKAKKPLLDTKRTLDEAIETIEVVYGKDHGLTQYLRQKKMQYDLAAVRV